jgi:transposase
MLAPVVRRSWAPRGATPVIYQPGRSHEKVSAIAALTVSPRWRRVGLYFSLLPDENVTVGELIAFLKQLRRHLRNPILLIWDRLPQHLARTLADFTFRSRGLHVELLPPYAPELNPVEAVWSYLKLNPLANLVPSDIHELTALARRHMRKIGRRQELLCSLLRNSPLFFWSRIGH